MTFQPGDRVQWVQAPPSYGMFASGRVIQCVDDTVEVDDVSGFWDGRWRVLGVGKSRVVDQWICTKIGQDRREVGT